MSAPTHVFIGVRHGRVFAIAATVETVSTWLEEEGADLIQRVPLAEARTLLFQPLPMLAEIDTLRAENERLRGALKPFEVKWLKAGLFQDEAADPIAVELRIVGTGWTDKVTVADLKAVRALLSEAQP